LASEVAHRATLSRGNFRLAHLPPSARKRWPATASTQTGIFNGLLFGSIDVHT
jgi:hypothetical protein